MADHHYYAFTTIICKSQGNKHNVTIGIHTANISLAYYVWYLNSVLEWESSILMTVLIVQSKLFIGKMVWGSCRFEL